MLRLSSPYDRLLLPVYLPSFMMAIAQEALTILLPLYVLELGGTPAFAALIAGLRGVGVLLFDVPAGMLVARFGDGGVRGGRDDVGRGSDRSGGARIGVRRGFHARRIARPPTDFNHW